MAFIDEVRCDFDISPDFKGQLCGTEDFVSDLGGSSFYYLDPAGVLWYADYYGTTEWVRDPTKPKPQPYVRLQTGKHGRVRPFHRYTGTLHLIPKSFKGRWEHTPIVCLNINKGKVDSYKLTTPQRNERRHQRHHSLQPKTSYYN